MKTRLWLSVVAIVLAVAAGIYYYRSDVAAETPTLNTAEVTRGDVVATVEATGTLAAVTTVEVGTQVSGTIKTLAADFNTQVRQGQVGPERGRRVAIRRLDRPLQGCRWARRGRGQPGRARCAWHVRAWAGGRSP